MKIMDLDMGRYDISIKIKDIDNKKIYVRNFGKNDLSDGYERIFKYIIRKAINYSVDQIHIDINGIGIMAYDSLKVYTSFNNDFKAEIIPFKVSIM